MTRVSNGRAASLLAMSLLVLLGFLLLVASAPVPIAAALEEEEEGQEVQHELADAEDVDSPLLQSEDQFEEAALADKDVDVADEEEGDDDDDEEEEEESFLEEDDDGEVDENFFLTGGFAGPAVSWPSPMGSMSASVSHHVAPNTDIHVMAPSGVSGSPFSPPVTGYPGYGYGYGYPGYPGYAPAAAGVVSHPVGYYPGVSTTTVYHPTVVVPHPTGYRQDFSSKVDVDHNLRTRPLWGGSTKHDFQTQFTERKLKHCLRRCSKASNRRACARNCHARAVKRAANLAADGHSSDFEHRLRHHVHSAPSAHSLRHKEVVHASTRVAAPDWNPYYAMKAKKGGKAKKFFQQQQQQQEQETPVTDASEASSAAELLDLLSEEEQQTASQLNDLLMQEQAEEAAEEEEEEAEAFVEMEEDEDEGEDQEEEEEEEDQQETSDDDVEEDFSELYAVPTLLGGVEHATGPTGNHINNVHHVKNINHNFSHVSTNSNTNTPGIPVAGVAASGKAGNPAMMYPTLAIGGCTGGNCPRDLNSNLMHSRRSLAEKREDLKRRLDAIKRRHDRLRRFMALKKKLNRIRERKLRLQRMRKLYMRIREKLASWPHIKRALKRKLDRLRLLRRLMALRKRSEGLARRRALAWFGRLKAGRIPRVVRHSVHRELKRRLRPLVHQRLRHHLQEKVHKTLYPYGPRLTTYAGMTRERQENPFRRMQRQRE